jgi:branched-chain amino acid transport system ATP-binding protein
MSREPVPALEVSSVSKNYGGVAALRSVSFSAPSGSILGLIGANGAGKTTLLDIIGGEQALDEGEIRLFGRHLAGAPHHRAQAGLARTFQRPQVSPEMTIYENVAVGFCVRELRSWPRTVLEPLRILVTGGIPSRSGVAAACDRIGLRDIDRPADILSFGELRLLEVARAIVQQPKVVLLDEPFPGVEDENIELLVKALRQLADDGHTVVLVDHNITIVQELVDEIVLMAQGQLAFVGSVADCVASDAFRYEYVGSGAKN